MSYLINTDKYATWVNSESKKVKVKIKTKKFSTTISLDRSVKKILESNLKQHKNIFEYVSYIYINTLNKYRDLKGRALNDLVRRALLDEMGKYPDTEIEILGCTSADYQRSLGL